MEKSCCLIMSLSCAGSSARRCRTVCAARSTSPNANRGRRRSATPSLRPSTNRSKRKNTRFIRLLTFCSMSTEVRDCERAEVLDHKRAAVHNGPGADLHPAAGQHLVKERNPRIWSSFAPIFNLMCRTESARLCTSRSVTA